MLSTASFPSLMKADFFHLYLRHHKNCPPPTPQPICGYKRHRNKMCCSSIWRKETSLISRNLLSLACKVFEEWPVIHYMCTSFSTGGLPHWRPGGGIAIQMLAVQVCGKMMNCTAVWCHLSHSFHFNKQSTEYNNL